MKMNKKIGWCFDCNIPILDSDNCDICSSQTINLNIRDCDLKPIFQEEREFYSKVIGFSLDLASPLPEGMCFESKGRIIIGGKKLFRVFLDSKNQDWKAVFFSKTKNEQERFEGSDLRKIIVANEEALRRLEFEAVTFLSNAIKDINLPAIISLSGGKDSACILTLLEETGKNIPAIFLKSGMEFPETVTYVNETAKFYEFELMELSPEHDFFDLCLELGPPSVFMPWCCKTQKFAPLSNYINRHFPKGIASIEGLRKYESRRRSMYHRISSNKAMPRKVTICPILNWTTFEVWLYTLWKNIPINSLYYQGFKRVGCWMCPHKSMNELKLTELLQPKLMKRWYDFLFYYAEENGKDKMWVEEGKWRSRREPYNLIPRHKKRKVDCSSENLHLYEIMDGPCESELTEFLKIFGNPMKVDGSKRSQKEFYIKGKDIMIYVKDTKIYATSPKRRMMRIFERQLLKAINCIKCGACAGTCNAIKTENKRFSIDAFSCSNCLKCTSSKYLRMGCIALNYKKNRFTWEEIS